MENLFINPFTLIRPGERPSTQSWLLFAFTFFLTAGIGLLLSGIIFFFAYNWAELHHLAKLGIIASGLVAATLGALCCGQRPLLRQILLLVASVLVGVLLAVYGQAYQLKSDSGFLAWALFILFWVIVADFDPLWVIFIVVLHIGLYVHFFENVSAILHSSNLVLIGLLAILPLYVKSMRIRPRWFVNLLFVGSAVTAIFGMWDLHHKSTNLLIFLSFMAVSCFYGWRMRNLTIPPCGSPTRMLGFSAS